MRGAIVAASGDIRVTPNSIAKVFLSADHCVFGLEAVLEFLFHLSTVMASYNSQPCQATHIQKGANARLGILPSQF